MSAEFRGHALTRCNPPTRHAWFTFTLVLRRSFFADQFHREPPGKAKHCFRRECRQTLGQTQKQPRYELESSD